MNKAAKAIIGIGAATLAIFGISKLVKGSTGATVHGTITDASTGQPIVGADVRIHDFGVPLSGHYSIDKSTKSDSQGKYSFSVSLGSIYIPPGWVGDGRGVSVEAIAFTYSWNGASLIIFEGENVCNLTLSH